MNCKTASVIAAHRERYELLCEGKIAYGRLKTSAFYNTAELVEFPTVGDEVEIIENCTGDSTIVKVLPRKSVFKRLNATPGQPDLAVAANFDYVFITMSLNKDFHVSKLERYLAVAWQSGGTPVIVLTKADLCEDRDRYVEEVLKVAPGVNFACVSSVTGEGFEGLEPYFAPGKTLVLLGSSGVGKSSFVNMVLGREEMLTGGIREADAQGRHTTTYKQSFQIPEEIYLPDGKVLKGGGLIIDTPGIRKLIVSEAQQGMQVSFEDIEELAGMCRFSDCKHGKEPGCAIKEALENGTLDKKRWRTYQDMQREEQFAAQRRKIMEKKLEKKMSKRKKY
ncbi:MAG: ribosome small subunit-dependent GTPase A [Lachnospiraceae bacterium]|nr:ribosome small subunit-dependent GTPase A [Lachnospiraceae bacterium]